MKRSTGVAVLVTVAVLVVAGNLPRLPWEDFALRWRAAVAERVAAWPQVARRAPARAHGAPGPATRTGHRPTSRPRVAVAPATLLATPRPSPAHAPSSPFAASLLPGGALIAAAAGGLAGLVALLVLALALRRDPRGRVWQLARRGWTPARIAPRARVPQDAVRTLLTPGVGARR